MSRQVILDILTERNRQDAKWGEQNHPDVHPDLGGRFEPQNRAVYEEGWKALCDKAARSGETNWEYIFQEELAEAMHAQSRGDRAAFREELVQAAAVLVAWIECIDRRNTR
jgi:hypothetical protein